MAKKGYKEDTLNKYHDKMLLMLKELPDFVGDYFLSIDLSKSHSTKFEYLRDIVGFFNYIVDAGVNDEIKEKKDITTQTLDSLDTKFINQYFTYLVKYENNGKEWTNENVTIRRKLSSIRGLYGYLCKNEIIKTNPALSVETPNVPEKKIIRMDKEETKEFLDVVKNGTNNISKMQQSYHDKQKERDFALMSLLLGTGIRVSECVGLNISDVDLRHYAIKVSRKGGKQAHIYMSDSLVEIMSDYVEYRKTLPSLKGHEEALFLSSQKKRLGVRAVEMLVKKYNEGTSTLKNITPHKLRSSFGSTLYENTGDIYLVAEILGHKSVDTTKKHYAEISDNYMKANRNKIEK